MDSTKEDLIKEFAGDFVKRTLGEHNSINGFHMKTIESWKPSELHKIKRKNPPNPVKECEMILRKGCLREYYIDLYCSELAGLMNKGSDMPAESL